MKNFSFVFLFLSLMAFTQKKEDSSLKGLLKELGDNACKCADSVKLMNREKKDIFNDINSCIDEQTGALQMGSLSMDAKNLEKNAKTVNGKKQINLNFNSNKNSKQYTDSYHQLERYLMENCPSVKNAANTSETKSEHFSDDEKAVDFYTKGDQEFKNKNWKEAVKFFELATKKDRNFIYAWDNLGLSYRQLGEYDNAINAYKSSLLIDPKGKMPLQNIPVAYIYKKEYQKAVDAYLELDKIYPDDPEAYYGIGNIYMNGLKDDEKALDYMCKAYVIYTKQKSPYRTDAEKNIHNLYIRFKDNGKESRFKEILKKNNINF